MREQLYSQLNIIRRSAAFKRDGDMVYRYHSRNQPLEQALFPELFSHFSAVLPVQFHRNGLPIL